jgi:hypothetical protein
MTNAEQFNRAYEQFNAARDAYKATGDHMHFEWAALFYDEMVTLAAQAVA